MAFDWIRFLSVHGIPYRSAGQRNIEIHCPFCGEADPSMHLAVSTQGRGWRCFRDGKHAGRSRARLIQALLRCDWARACDLAGYDAALSVQDEGLTSNISRMLGLAVERKPVTLKFPISIKPLDGAVRARPYWAYLDDRLTRAGSDWATETYRLHYAISGPWAGRVVIPVHDSRGQIMTWTARSIRAEAHIRYKTLAADPDSDGCAAIKPPGDLLLGLPMLWGCDNPRTLVICEGPFDAIRLSCAGASRGVYGTCLFGLRMSASQADLVEQLAGRFSRVRLLLDNDAQLKILDVLGMLTVRVGVARLPEGIKDPGALRPSQAEALVGELLAA